MYVIRVSNSTGNTHTVAGIEIIDGDSAYFPADRCVWKYFGIDGQEYSDGQYDINRVFFTAGSGDPVNLNNETGVSGTMATTLGYIGKTGRFVGMTR